MLRNIRDFVKASRQAHWALVVGIGGVAWYMLSSEDNANVCPLAVRSGAEEGEQRERVVHGRGADSVMVRRQ